MHRIAEDYNAVYVPLLRPFDEALPRRVTDLSLMSG